MIKSIFATVTLTAALTAYASAAQPNIVEVASSNPSFSTLVAALKAADLVNAVKDGTFTVFAPTNDAFEQLPKGTLENLLKPENKKDLVNVLKYHLIPGSGYPLPELLERKQWGTAADQNVDIRFADGTVKIGNALLQTSDIACANGIVHVIDQVLLPKPTGPANLVETAKSAGIFKTLLTAATEAGLADTLAGSGPFTVFAPTDDAFAKLSKCTLDSLLKPENRSQLVNLLKYHVISGKVTAGDALNAGTATMLNDQKLAISFKDGALRTQWAKVVKVDIEAANGIIHVIDSVMLPPNHRNAMAPTRNHLDTIVTAINKGVPTYNHGNHEKCAQIYMDASQTLLKANDVPHLAKMALRKALTKASHSHCSNTRAWALREGLDNTYVVLQAWLNNQTASN